jgi:hypothetical protein
MQDFFHRGDTEIASLGKWKVEIGR